MSPKTPNHVRCRERRGYDSIADDASRVVSELYSLGSLSERLVL